MGALTVMEKCLIVGGGEIKNKDWLNYISMEYDYIIAADRGYKSLKEANVNIDIAIGDFDSLGFIPDDVEVIRLAIEKDDTDTISAVRYALDNSAKVITLVGGVGGRLDHTIANIQSLAFIASNGAVGRLLDENNELISLTSGEYNFPKRKGYSLSVFAITDEVTCLRERGVKYPLVNATLTNKFPLGVSNEITSESAVISFKSGMLLVCFSRL